MCGDWGMCKSNYLLTAVAEREGWEWHRGSSRRWAPSICHSTPLHSTPLHNPLLTRPLPLFCLSVCPSYSHSLCPSASLDLSWYIVSSAFRRSFDSCTICFFSWSTLPTITLLNVYWCHQPCKTLFIFFQSESLNGENMKSFLNSQSITQYCIIYSQNYFIIYI